MPNFVAKFVVWKKFIFLSFENKIEFSFIILCSVFLT